jgi:hypothetical protein
VTTAVVALSVLVSLTGPAHAGARHPRGIRVPSAFFGMHDGSTAAYRHLHIGSVRLWDAGVSWRDIETSPGVFDWSRLDALVHAAQLHDAQVTLVLGMTPSFYSATSTLPPTTLSHYADYARAVMTRYRSFSGSRGIDAYQVWNEANVSTFWTGTAGQLGQLTRILDHVRDQVDPSATVVAPSFAVRLRSQLAWMSRYESQRVGRVPVWRHFDVNAPSLYPKAIYAGRRIGAPEDGMRLLTRVRHRLARAGVPQGLPIWGSEMNYGVRGGPGQPEAATPISDERQVANVIRTYLLGAARGLDRVFWYRYDWGWVPALGGTLGNTLLTVPGHWDEVTPAGSAFNTVRGWLHGRLVDVDGRRPCARDRRGTYTCVVLSAHGRRTILWNPSRTVEVPFRGATYRQRAGAVGAPVTGAVTQVRVDYRPVMLRSPR